MTTENATTSGLGFGCCLAIVISWGLNHSILWAMWHGFCSWIYVLYYALVLR